MSAEQIAVDAQGRLLVLAIPNRSLATATVFALNGSTASLGGSGPFTLLPGGVLDVAGTSKKDSIVLAAFKSDRVNVTVNGKFRRFYLKDITGIVIHSGSGDDIINAATLQNRVTIQGGSGNDRITAGTAADSIDGGDGDDFILGGDGDDTLLGGNGKDSLLGGYGADTLYGGSDVDSLYGSDTRQRDDKANNLLYGNGSRDLLFGSIHDQRSSYKDILNQ